MAAPSSLTLQQTAPSVRDFNSPRHGKAPAPASFQTVVFSRKTTSHGPDGEITEAFKKQQRAAEPPSPLASLVHQTDRHGKHTSSHHVDTKVRPTAAGQSGGISKLFANICSALGLPEQQQQLQAQMLKKQAHQVEKSHETRQSIEVRKIMSTPFPGDEGKKCLVLDLDETLVHSSFKPIHNPDYIIPVEIEGHVHQVYVLKRPGVDEFMRVLAEHYEIVVYTASLSKYADPLLDQLDIHNVIRFRLFREHCVHYEGSYVKDLSLIDRDITQSVIIDNSPMSYLFHPRNAIGCSSFIDDLDDRELDSISAFLTEIRSVDDVRNHLHRWSPQ
ncbi:protein phosphatase [Saprolegnia diclina VS20]|uniref:protein-serine/threonine phosphatase n=1 Tax=Saprolegnia diclina (strain VS20) TaxID=1156394 RepID=T0R8C7_SAPDV|nr:protein phosphatase [Saprolegnia diclina VS20]EQC25747.1 protein phosphatase [Saprolegnia diclina VS20]|eukprot:XP_008620839.1 protein phosphatase [Saprolegnia diclina VS20]